MATSTYGTPYVQGSDLVSAYPTVSSSLATRVDEVSYARNGLDAQTGTTYTLVAGDAGKTITLSNASPVAVTLPQDSTADLPDGAVVAFYNLGAGTVTISQGTGATLQGGSIALAQYEVTTIIKLSANTYGKFDGAPAPGLSQITPTSIANSGGTATLTGGAVAINAVTSVSLNGVFTSTYENYRLVFVIGHSATGISCALRLRAAGTDATGTDYYSGTQGYTSGGAAVNVAQSAANSLHINWGTTHTFPITLDIGRPQIAATTGIVGLSAGVGGSGSGNDAYFRMGGAHFVSTSYDGFTVFPGSGTITGTLRVYGYRN